MRLFLITAGSLICTAIVLLIVRFWGLSQSYLPYDNHFFETTGTWLIVPWDFPPIADNPHAKEWVLWANVYQQKQGPLVVAASSDALNRIDRTQNPDAKRPLLSDFLQKHPTERIIFNILENKDQIQNQFDAILKASEGLKLSKERFVIQSEYNNVISSIKELEPRLVYGSTVADLMRLKSYDGLGLVSAAPFPGDVFISSLKFSTDSPRAGARNAIGPDIASELHRRFKKIILGPISSKAEYDQAISLGADGVIIQTLDQGDKILTWLYAE